MTEITENGSMERERELFFAKHLWQLFWTLIPMEIGSVLMLFETGSFYYWCGWSVVLVTDCYYSVTLFCLSKEEKEYRAAGIGILVSALLQHMQEAIQALTYGDGLILLSLIIIPVSIYGTYYFCRANAQILQGKDDILSDNWRKIWKWQKISYFLMAAEILSLFCGALLEWFLFVFAALSIGTSIFAVVIRVMQIVYLYRSAKCFENQKSQELN